MKNPLLYASDNRYYFAWETFQENEKILPRPWATPRDSFGRTLDEETVDDATLASACLN